MTADRADERARSGVDLVQAAASASLAEVLLGLAREFEEASDAPAADLAIWLAELYARIGSNLAAVGADEGMEDAPEHAYQDDVMVRVAERLDRESALLRGDALDPANTVAFLTARSAEALVELLRSEAAEAPEPGEPGEG